MRLVVLESPLAGDVERNLRYARACMRDCLLRGEAPFASHLLYAQDGVLDDLVHAEREIGIRAGLAIGARFDATVVYTDLGVSHGMERGIGAAIGAERPVEYRKLGLAEHVPLGERNDQDLLRAYNTLKLVLESVELTGGWASGDDLGDEDRRIIVHAPTSLRNVLQLLDRIMRAMP